MFHEGKQIGNYTLIRRLGRGGFGEVWLAERRAKFVTTKVAVKLPLDEQVDHAAIEQEAQLWEQASGHPNVLPIIEADLCDGQIVIVSEYAPDGSLEELLKTHGKLEIKQAVEMTVGILNGLEFLHSRNIIHRDLKPANILLQGTTPRLADFGISRAMRTTMASQSQHISGTFAYMSPEALDGRRSVQTDIWSVGVNLYQFLTGTLPFPQKEFTQLLIVIASREPEPLPDFVPPELKRIIAKSLAKLPEKRYQNANEMGKDLRKFLLQSQHPTFAPTKVFDKPTTEETQTEIITVKAKQETDETQKIETENQPYYLTKIKPAVLPETVAAETEQIPLAPTQASPLKSESVASKLLPTVAREYAQAIREKRKRPWLIYAGAGVLGLVLILGSFVIYDITSHSKYCESSVTTPFAFVEPPTLIPFRKGDKWGYSDKNKILIISARYDFAEPFIDGIAIVKKDKKYGLIDSQGNEIIKPKYDYISSFSEDLAVVQLNEGHFEDGISNFKEKFGFIGKNGNEVIPVKYQSAFSFSENLAIVELNGEQFYIDRNGMKTLKPLKSYESIYSFSEGLARVKLDDKWGFIDKTGEEIIPLKYELAADFSDGIAQVQISKEGLYGGSQHSFIDKNDKEIISIGSGIAYSFSEGLAFIETANNGKFINKRGSEVISSNYFRSGSYFSDGLTTVRTPSQGYISKSLFSPSGTKDGFIDKQCNEVIPLEYHEVVRSFSKGLALVQLNLKEFYIDQKGTEYYEP